MIINIFKWFSWVTWIVIIIILFILFWLFFGGKEEYEFIGIKPLATSSMFSNIPTKSVYPDIDYKYTLDQNDLSHNSSDDSINEYDKEENLYVSEYTNIPKTNKGEDIVAEVLEEILQSKIKRNIRPNFLKNPESNANLELDCYNEEYAIAVEYNGIQHYKFPSVFHKTEQEFMNQVYRDRLKVKLCDEANVYLIPVPYWVDVYENHESHIKDKDSKYKYTPVSREIRYKRIYKYLYEKISEYFEIIFPQQENDKSKSNSDREFEYNFE